jgi:hypothetical protein
MPSCQWELWDWCDWSQALWVHFSGTLNAAQAYIVNDVYLKYINPGASNRKVIRAVCGWRVGGNDWGSSGFRQRSSSVLQ